MSVPLVNNIDRTCLTADNIKFKLKIKFFFCFKNLRWTILFLIPPLCKTNDVLSCVFYALIFLFFTDLCFWLSSHTSTKIPRVPQVLFSFCPPVRGIRGKAFDCSVRWRTLVSFVCCLFNSWKQINTFSVAVTPQKFVFVFVWFLAGRKTRRLNNKSKQ